jgi:hypothetical protein
MPEAARRDGARAPSPGPPLAEAEDPAATPACGWNAPRGAPVRDRRGKTHAGAIPRGGCRRGKGWEARRRPAADPPRD